jgi:signal transduction histidine kinase
LFYTPENLRDYPVLYVDDEQANCLVFEAAFGRDFNVSCAPSGREALRMLDESPFAVLMADHKMPGMTGTELCERARETHPDVVRLLVTAYSSHETAIEAINRGRVLHYIAKPWHVEEVREVLRAAITHSHVHRMDRQLRAAIVERERLAGVAAARASILHDLGNAVVVVGGLCEMMQDLLASNREGLSPGQVAQLIDDLAGLRSAVEHIQALHRERRRFELRRPGEPGVHRVAELVATLSSLIGLGHAVTLQVECRDDLTVCVDPVDVTRILLNLVTNASQAVQASGNPGGVIRIDARPVARALEGRDGVEITVSDDGPGIPAELREQVFEMFFTTRQAAGGTGLGLAICKSLAEANGGSLQLRDPTEGAGATFALVLPVDAPPS